MLGIRQAPKSLLASLVVTILFIFMFGCAGQKFELNHVDTTPEIVKEDIKIEIDDDIVIEGFELQVNGYVKSFNYESNLYKILFSFGPEKDKSNPKTFILYDLESHDMDWVQEGNPYVNVMNEDVIQFIKGQTSNLYDTKDGNFLRKSENGLYLTGDGDAFILSSKKVARINIYTGEVFWQKEGYDWEGYREEFSDEDWMYIVAEGLHAFKKEDGEGWDFEVSNSYKDHMKEMAKQCGLSLLAALGGGYNTSQYRPDIYHNLNSNVLINGDNLYFAARANVYCFDRFNGTIIWQQELPEELGGMWIEQISDENIVLTGQGWKYMNYGVTKALPPSFTIFNMNSGEIQAQFKSDDNDFLFDSDFSQPNKYILTSKCLYTFDSDYNLIAQLNKTDKYGYFLRLVDTGDVLVIRTEMGVLSLNKNSLEEVWFTDLGGLPMENKEKYMENWTYPYILSNFEERRNWSSDDFDWFAAIDGIATVDIFNNGEIIQKIAVSGDDFIISRDGNLINMFEDRLTFITLK